MKNGIYSKWWGMVPTLIEGKKGRNNHFLSDLRTKIWHRKSENESVFGLFEAKNHFLSAWRALKSAWASALACLASALAWLASARRCPKCVRWTWSPKNGSKKGKNGRILVFLRHKKVKTSPFFAWKWSKTAPGYPNWTLWGAWRANLTYFEVEKHSEMDCNCFEAQNLTCKSGKRTKKRTFLVFEDTNGSKWSPFWVPGWLASAWDALGA